MCFRFLQNLKTHCDAHKQAVVRWEYAAGCRFLHRGFYCPSLILPRVLKGAKMGKVLKRITSRSNPCFEYGFNDANQLIISKQLDHGTVKSTEYLFYQQDSIYGFTVNSDGELESISEEIYKQGRLMRYSIAPFSYFLEQPGCDALSREEYEIHPKGNLTGHWHQFMLSSPSEDHSVEESFGIDPIVVHVYLHDVYSLSDTTE